MWEYQDLYHHGVKGMHITLGAWLKDYVMYPLQRCGAIAGMGKRLGKRFGRKAARRIPVFICMFVLWMCMGLWHGGGYNYLLEGVWFWLVIVLGQLLAPCFDKLTAWLRLRTDCFSWKLFQQARTLLIYAVGVLFFRADDAAVAFCMLRSGLKISNAEVLFDVGQLMHMAGWEAIDAVVLGVSLLALCLGGILKYRHTDVRLFIARQNLPFRWLCYLTLLFAIILFGKYGPGYVAENFIYAGF